MARSLRIVQLGVWYHLAARGIGRRDIYRDDRDRAHFVALLEGLCERFRTRLLAYVLMDNHNHLLLELREPNLSAAIRWLNINQLQRLVQPPPSPGRPPFPGPLQIRPHRSGGLGRGPERLSSFEPRAGGTFWVGQGRPATGSRWRRSASRVCAPSPGVRIAPMPG